MKYNLQQLKCGKMIYLFFETKLLHCLLMIMTLDTIVTLLGTILITVVLDVWLAFIRQEKFSESCNLEITKPCCPEISRSAVPNLFLLSYPKQREESWRTPLCLEKTFYDIFNENLGVNSKLMTIRRWDFFCNPEGTRTQDWEQRLKM